jgi:hypothetical protein
MVRGQGSKGRIVTALNGRNKRIVKRTVRTVAAEVSIGRTEAWAEGPVPNGLPLDQFIRPLGCRQTTPSSRH